MLTSTPADAPGDMREHRPAHPAFLIPSVASSITVTCIEYLPPRQRSSSQDERRKPLEAVHREYWTQARRTPCTGCNIGVGIGIGLGPPKRLTVPALFAPSVQPIASSITAASDIPSLPPAVAETAPEMSPSPQRGSSRFAPRIAQSLSPPTRSSASPGSNTVGAARSGIPSATGARPSLSAFTSAASASASARTPPAGSRSVSAERAAPTGHAFRTISAGTLRNNNPFAQRLQLAFAPASRSSGVQVQEGITAEIGMISSSPIYDRQRTQPDVDMSASSPATPHTPPLHIVKSANLKSKTSTSTPNSSAEKVSGIPQPYTSRFNSPSLFTPPPGGASRGKAEARLVSPTLDIPEPRAHQHQPLRTGRAGSESPSPAAASNGRHTASTGIPMAPAPAGQVVRKSRFINQPRSPADGRDGMSNQLYPKTSM